MNLFCCDSRWSQSECGKNQPQHILLSTHPSRVCSSVCVCVYFRTLALCTRSSQMTFWAQVSLESCTKVRFISRANVTLIWFFIFRFILVHSVVHFSKHCLSPCTVGLCRSFFIHSFIVETILLLKVFSLQELEFDKRRLEGSHSPGSLLVVLKTFSFF